MSQPSVCVPWLVTLTLLGLVACKPGAEVDLSGACVATHTITTTLPFESEPTLETLVFDPDLRLIEQSYRQEEPAAEVLAEWVYDGELLVSHRSEVVGDGSWVVVERSQVWDELGRLDEVHDEQSEDGLLVVAIRTDYAWHGDTDELVSEEVFEGGAAEPRTVTHHTYLDGRIVSSEGEGPDIVNGSVRARWTYEDPAPGLDYVQSLTMGSSEMTVEVDFDGFGRPILERVDLETGWWVKTFGRDDRGNVVHETIENIDGREDDVARVFDEADRLVRSNWSSEGPDGSSTTREERTWTARGQPLTRVVSEDRGNDGLIDERVEERWSWSCDGT